MKIFKAGVPDQWYVDAEDNMGAIFYGTKDECEAFIKQSK